MEEVSGGRPHTSDSASLWSSNLVSKSLLALATDDGLDDAVDVKSSMR